MMTTGPWTIAWMPSTAPMNGVAPAQKSKFGQGIVKGTFSVSWKLIVATSVQELEI